MGEYTGYQRLSPNHYFFQYCNLGMMGLGFEGAQNTEENELWANNDQDFEACQSPRSKDIFHWLQLVSDHNNHGQGGVEPYYNHIG